VSAHRDPVAVWLARWGRRHKTVVASAVVLLLTAVVGLALGLWAVDGERRRTAAERDQKDRALEAEATARKQTRAALDAMSSRLIEDWLAKQAVLLPEHKRFLELALRYYEEFAADTGQQEESRAGVANAYFRVGSIRELLGHRKDAEAA